MRVLLDMGLSPRTAEFLRESGIDAVHLFEMGLGQMADEEIIGKATKESRIILTFDSDFPRLLSQLRLSGPSVVLIRLARFETHALSLRLLGLLRAQESELMMGVVLVVEPNRARMHRLPLGQPPVE